MYQHFGLHSDVLGYAQQPFTTTTNLSRNAGSPDHPIADLLPYNMAAVYGHPDWP
jgi:hypothetical protein